MSGNPILEMEKLRRKQSQDFVPTRDLPKLNGKPISLDEFYRLPQGTQGVTPPKRPMLVAFKLDNQFNDFRGSDI